MRDLAEGGNDRTAGQSWFGLAGGGAIVRLSCVLADVVRMMELAGGNGRCKRGFGRQNPSS